MKVAINGKVIEGLRCAEFVSKRDANKFAKELEKDFSRK